MKYFVLSLSMAVILGICGCRPHPSPSTVDVSSAAWDDLAAALNIKPFYISMSSAVLARSFSIEFDLYDGGELHRTISAYTLRKDNAEPLNVNAAVFFMPPENGTTTVAVTVLWEGSLGRSRITIKEDELSVTDASFSHLVSDVANPPERLPLFALVSGERAYLLSDLEAIPNANPDSQVLIGYLIAE